MQPERDHELGKPGSHPARIHVLPACRAPVAVDRGQASPAFSAGVARIVLAVRPRSMGRGYAKARGQRECQGASHHGVPNTATIFRVSAGNLPSWLQGPQLQARRAGRYCAWRTLIARPPPTAQRADNQLPVGIGFGRLGPPGLLRAHDRELGLHSFLLFLGQDRAFPGWRHVMDRRKGRSDLRTLRRVLRHATCRYRQLRHT
jgi:hypothetical protein